MQHTEEAIKSANPTENFSGWNLDEFATAHNWAGVGLLPVSQHRDSEALERSNFDSAIDELSTKYGEANIDIVRFGHWAVGWLEVAVHNTGVDGIAEAVADIKKRLDEYPMLDDNLWSQYEWNDNHPKEDGVCYQEDGDCPCGLEKAYQ